MFMSPTLWFFCLLEMRHLVNLEWCANSAFEQLESWIFLLPVALQKAPLKTRKCVCVIVSKI